jgi:hypothetical protein
MLKLSIKIITGLVFLVTALSCNKETINSNCLEGKLIDAFCADYIIQITDGEFDRSVADATWTDPVSGNVYQNVFRLKNYCHLQERSISNGTIFNFRISKENYTNNCVTCLAIRPGPGPVTANSIILTNCTPR